MAVTTGAGASAQEVNLNVGALHPAVARTTIANPAATVAPHARIAIPAIPTAPIPLITNR
jgi:hypothetical protein